MLDYIQFHKNRLDENGRRLVVRNGHLPEREVISCIGSDSAIGTRALQQCDSAQVYMRRAPSVDALIPALYLKGISTGDFSEALTAILGEGANGLSATNIVRLKSSWETDHKAWSQRDLSAKRYVYWWAAGVYFNVRLDEERTCVLVLIGATEDGSKELLAVAKTLNPGVNCLVSSAWVYRRRPSWLPVTDHWASGLLCRKNTVQSFNSVAGFIRPPISWIKCPKAFRAKRSN